MANKTMKVVLPEESPVWRDLVEYGREMGMQPAETTRVILAEWSRAMRGRTPFGAMMPQFSQMPAPTSDPGVPNKRNASVERERAKGARFAGTFDDD
jgi:hypothetical protein